MDFMSLTVATKVRYKMNDVIRISKDEDKAVIMSLKSQPGVKLSTAQITNYAIKFIKVPSRAAFYKKIERMRNDEFLLYEKDKSNNYIHWLNPEIEFVLEGQPLKFLKEPTKGASSAQLQHASDLKEAMRTWIDNLAEPNPDFRLGTAGYSNELSVADGCENHTLFRDLSNHLPALGIKICDQWRKYKSDLQKLLELKVNLLSSLKSGISECFQDLKFDFTSHGNKYPSKHAFLLISMGLYDMVIHLDQGDGVEYNEESISALDQMLHTFVRKNGDNIQWGEDRILLSVTEEDQALFDECMKKFSILLINIPNSEFMVMAKDIIALVGRMKPEREHILRKLREAMLYANYPGKCQYLGNSIQEQ
jgi:hypothetical protein